MQRFRVGTHEIMGNPSPTPTSELEQIHPSVAIDYGAKKRQSPSRKTLGSHPAAFCCPKGGMVRHPLSIASHAFG